MTIEAERIVAGANTSTFPRRGLIRRILIGLLVVAGLAIALNVTGLVPIPIGPLGDLQPAVADGSRSTVDYEPGRAAIYLSPAVEDSWPISATVVRVTPVGVAVPGSVEVVGSLPFTSDDPYGPDSSMKVLLGVQADPGQVWASPQPATGLGVDPKGSAQFRGRAFLVRITADPAMPTSVLRFDVEYTIGPFHFVTTAWGPAGTTVVMCPPGLPMATESGCAAS